VRVRACMYGLLSLLLSGDFLHKEYTRSAEPVLPIKTRTPNVWLTFLS